MRDYVIDFASSDGVAAFGAEADRAEAEGMKGVAERQRATALHLRNAVIHMQKHCPDGYRVQTEIVVSLVPAVNPTLSVIRD